MIDQAENVDRFAILIEIAADTGKRACAVLQRVGADADFCIRERHNVRLEKRVIHHRCLDCHLLLPFECCHSGETRQRMRSDSLLSIIAQAVPVRRRRFIVIVVDPHHLEALGVFDRRIVLLARFRTSIPQPLDLVISMHLARVRLAGPRFCCPRRRSHRHIVFASARRRIDPDLAHLVRFEPLASSSGKYR